MAEKCEMDIPYQEDSENIAFMPPKRRSSQTEFLSMEEGRQPIQQVNQQDDKLYDQNTSQSPPIDNETCEENGMITGNEEYEKQAYPVLEKVSEMVGNDDIRFVYLVDGEMKDNTTDILRRGLDMYPTRPFIIIWYDKAEIFLKKDIREVSRLQSNERDKRRKSTIISDTRYVPLPGDAAALDNLNLRLTLQKLLLRKYKCFCLKMLIGILEHMFMPKWIEEYMLDHIPVLLVDSSSGASTAFHSYFRAIRTGSKELKSSKLEFRNACKRFTLQWDDFKVLYRTLEKNSLKAHSCKLPHKSKLNEFTASIRIAICNGIAQSITFLMDSSEEIARSLASESRYCADSKIILFPNMTKQGQYKGELNVAVFKQYKETFAKVESSLKKHKEMITVLKYNGETFDQVVHYDTVKGNMSSENIKKQCALVCEYSDSKLTELSPVLKFHCALKRSKHEHAEEILKTNALDIYPYIYFNISTHWRNTGWHKKTMVTDYFKITDKWKESDVIGCKSRFVTYVDFQMQQDKGAEDGIGEKINNAVFKLSSNMVAKLFENDGRPNIKVANPIQALMVNRLLCLEVEFVNVLWKYDKKNCLTNALLLWMLTEGILREGIFKERHSADFLIRFKKYIDDTMIKLLNISQHCYQDHYSNPVLSKSPIFKNRRLIDVAGELEYETFFSQTIARRIVAYEWRQPVSRPEQAACCHKQSSSMPEQEDCSHKQAIPSSDNQHASRKSCTETLRKLRLLPRNKLYIHMAIGERGKISLGLKRWSLDPWNILDSITMFLYYFGITLDFAGSSDSRYVLAIVTFIWCLKFYQFLRAFESVGTYIIMVQKMLPHLWSFSLVALVALIAYGVFMTSIMFPSHHFESWNTLLFMLIRPYLLLFAETGIDEYEFSKSTTLFNTKKIPTAYEVITVLGMCVFLLFGGILLLNLLIAVFSGVYEEVKEKSLRLWVINDFQLLKEFIAKPSLPIPFSAFRNLQLIVARFTEKEEEITLEDKDRVEMEKQQERVMKKFLERKDKNQQSIDMVKEVREQNQHILSLLEKLNIKPGYKIKGKSTGIQ